MNKNQQINSEIHASNILSQGIFTILNDHEKELISHHLSCQKFNKGEFIFTEGDKPNGLLCLCEGKAKIFKEGIGGRDQIVRLAKPYGFIGYRALFAEEDYNASAVALEDSVICKIDKQSIFNVVDQNSLFAKELIKSMASELGLSNTRTVSLTQKHIRGRLAESLIFLIDTYGYEDDGKTINAYLSREDLANLSNMTTSNAIRTLSAFSHEGVIELDGRRIKVLSYNELSRISDLG